MTTTGRQFQPGAATRDILPRAMPSDVGAVFMPRGYPFDGFVGNPVDPDDRDDDAFEDDDNQYFPDDEHDVDDGDDDDDDYDDEDVDVSF